MKVLIGFVIGLAVGAGVCLYLHSKDVDSHQRHDNAMHEEHSFIVTAQQAIMSKVEDNGRKLDVILNYLDYTLDKGKVLDR